MKPEEIIKAAWKGKRPVEMKLYEHRLYCEMALSYAMFRRGETDKVQGERDKAAALKHYEEGKLKHDAIAEVYGAID